MNQPDRSERYATAIHDAMETDLSLMDQEPAFQALIARTAEAAMALADAELAVPSADQNRQFLTTLANLGIASHRLNQIRDAVRLHRQQIIGTSELYAVIDADDPVPPPADHAAVRAAALREAADALGRMDYGTDSQDYGYDTYRDAWNGGVMDAAALLRRMADEQPAPLDPAAIRVVALREAADWFEQDGRMVQRFFGHQVAAVLRRLAGEQPTNSEAPTPCSEVPCNHDGTGEPCSRHEREADWTERLENGRAQLLEAMSAVSEYRTCCGWAVDWARTLHAEGGIWETLGRAVGWPTGNYDQWVWVSWDEAAALYAAAPPSV